MTTEYQFIDSTGVVRLDGTLDPDPAGGEVPIGPAGGDLAGTYPNPTIKSSVALAGVPTAATAAGGTSTTQIATTAFVATSFAPKASPTFTGTVTTAALRVNGNVGFYNTAPIAQPAAPVTLGDVIAALQALGLVAT